MRVGDRHFRCPRCGAVKELSTANVYFTRRGIDSYCRPCRVDYFRAYVAAGKLTRPAHYSRDWNRKKRGIPPERWKHGAEAAS